MCRHKHLCLCRYTYTYTQMFVYLLMCTCMYIIYIHMEAEGDREAERCAREKQCCRCTSMFICIRALCSAAEIVAEILSTCPLAKLLEATPTFVSTCQLRPSLDRLRGHGKQGIRESYTSESFGGSESKEHACISLVSPYVCARECIWTQDKHSDLLS